MDVFSKIQCLLVSLVVFFIACEKGNEETIQENVAPAAKLNYTQQKISFFKLSDANHNGKTKKLIDKKLIEKGIQGDKTGYEITEIHLKSQSPKDTKATKLSNNNIVLEAPGAITFSVKLTHRIREDVFLKKCIFNVEKGDSETLIFNPLSETYNYLGNFDTAKILANITGNKTGYTLKSIKGLNPENIAEVWGKKPNLKLRIKKGGIFTADLILEHRKKNDATIKKAKFEIKKGASLNLSFTKMIKIFEINGRFTGQEIFQSIKGNKNEYTFKKIKDINPMGIVRLSGSGSNFNLNFRSAGSFTATLVLEHPTQEDVIIKNAEFEIEKTASENLIFNKMIRKFEDNGSFDSNELLNHLTGGDADGYKIKAITHLNPSGIVMLKGTSPNISMDFIKTGDFTATLILEHSIKNTVKIVNAYFSIEKANAESLTFVKLTKSYEDGGSFSSNEILHNLRGNRLGYRLKKINLSSGNNVVAVQGEAPNIGISFTNVGNFEATLILQHPNKKDATVTKASFEITEGIPPTLNFVKLVKPYKSSGEINNVDIFKNIQGKKSNYTIKEITSPKPTGIVILKGAKPTFTLDILKIGNFTVDLVLEHPKKRDITISNAQFEIQKNQAENLVYRKLSEKYSNNGSFTTNEILSHLQGNKRQYTIKSINTLNPSGIVRIAGFASNLSLEFIKAGNFTATLVFEHPTKEDVTIRDCEFEIQKLTAPTLTFDKLSKTYSKNGVFSSSEIVNKLQGDKTGYTLQSISTLNPSNIAMIAGQYPNIRLDFVKSGDFIAVLVFKHPIKEDIIIKNAEFEIQKLTAPTLTFDKRKETYTDNGTFTTAEILSNIKGDKTGYRLRAIKTMTPSDFASISIYPNLLINFLKAGSFTVTLVLEHTNKEKVEITDAAFEIGRAFPPSLQFMKLSKLYSVRGTFSYNEILANIQGIKRGYILTTIKNISDSNIASISRTVKPYIEFKKAGIFTATLVLTHDSKQNVEIKNAVFEIKKITPELLTFRKLTKTYIVGDSFSKAEIMGNIVGNKTDYTLKNIVLTGDPKVTVVGTKPNFSLHFQKGGDFSTMIVLEHPYKGDTTIKGAAFKITKLAPPLLGFTTLTSSYIKDRSFEKADILNNITGDKIGYRLKNISAITPLGIFSLHGTKPNFELNFEKVGSITATLVLEHNTKQDVTIPNAAFRITKIAAERLSFTRLSAKYITRGNFIAQKILDNVQGRKTGYTIKSISNISDAAIANVIGTKPNLGIEFISIGNFTADIVLEHPHKNDTSIRGAEFQINKNSPSRLRFNKLSKPYITGASFTTAEILGNVTGVKAGYRIKAIRAILPVGIVNQAGTAPNISLNYLRGGNFTATIVLEHDTKEDVIITNASFKINTHP